MPADLSDITDAVTNATTIETSAVELINGIQGRIDAAVAAALDKGATAEQLQPVKDLSAALKSENQALADAIQANTPPPQP